MTLLLEFREKLKNFYAGYSLFLQPLLKFLLALAIFKGINWYLPFVEPLDNIFVLLVMALICSILSLNAIVLFGGILIIGQCYGVGIETAGFALGLFLIMIILYIRFTPGDAIVLLLTPLAFRLGIPCAVPIGFGLTRSPASAVPAVFGVILYYFLELVHGSAEILKSGDPQQMSENLKLLLDGLMNNQNMMMEIIAFVTVLLAVNVIRRLSVSYSWQIAICTGGMAYLVILVAGGLIIDVGTPVLPMIAGTVGAVLVSLILEFFLFNVDYTRTEYLQYEDDDYYYYVKAVPKRSISQKQVVVKTIQEEPAATVSRAPEAVPVHQPGPVPQETITFTGMIREEEKPLQAPVTEETSAEISGKETDFQKELEESLKNL